MREVPLAVWIPLITLGVVWTGLYLFICARIGKTPYDNWGVRKNLDEFKQRYSSSAGMMTLYRVANACYYLVHALIIGLIVLALRELMRPAPGP